MSFYIMHPPNRWKVIKIFKIKIFSVPAHLAKTCIFHFGLCVFSKKNLGPNNLGIYLSETTMYIVGPIIQKYLSNSGSFLGLNGPDLNKTRKFCITGYIMPFSWTSDVYKCWCKGKIGVVLWKVTKYEVQSFGLGKNFDQAYSCLIHYYKRCVSCLI